MLLIYLPIIPPYSSTPLSTPCRLVSSHTPNPRSRPTPPPPLCPPPSGTRSRPMRLTPISCTPTHSSAVLSQKPAKTSSSGSPCPSSIVAILLLRSILSYRAHLGHSATTRSSSSLLHITLLRVPLERMSVSQILPFQWKCFLLIHMLHFQILGLRSRTYYKVICAHTSILEAACACANALLFGISQFLHSSNFP